MIAVAIDGPAGAGKSTIARTVAKKMGLLYVDTGALYRTVGLYMIRRGIPPDDACRVREAVQDGGMEIRLAFQNGEQRVLLCGEDVTQEIRTPEVSIASSQVSAVPEVRRFLFSLQRDLAKEHSVIMDGRAALGAGENFPDGFPRRTGKPAVEGIAGKGRGGGLRAGFVRHPAPGRKGFYPGDCPPDAGAGRGDGRYLPPDPGRSGADGGIPDPGGAAAGINLPKGGGS